MVKILRYIIVNYFVATHLTNDLDQNKAQDYWLINLKSEKKNGSR